LRVSENAASLRKVTSFAAYGARTIGIEFVTAGRRYILKTFSVFNSEPGVTACAMSIVGGICATIDADGLAKPL
jgi:hypothetical protein